MASQQQGPAASRWLLNPTSAAASNPAVLNGLTSYNDIHFDNTSVAAFAQFTWHVTDRFRLEPGVRVNYDEKDGSYVATVVNATNTPLTSDQRGVLAPQIYQARVRRLERVGRLDVLLRVHEGRARVRHVRRSFKSGGINLSGLPLDAGNNPDPRGQHGRARKGRTTTSSA